MKPRMSEDSDGSQTCMSILVLQEWGTKGYSIRQIITDALIKLDEAQEEPPITQLDELYDTLNQVNHLLEQLGNGDSTHIIKSDRPAENSGLADHFIESIKKQS